MARMTARTWAVVLFCSLALNVLLAGVITSAFWRRDSDMASRMAVYSVPWASRVIGPEVEELTRRVYSHNQATMRHERQALMADYAAVNRTLAAPEFEHKKFVEALGRLRTNTLNAQATMHQSMAEFAAELSPEQREVLAASANKWAAKREKRALKRAQELELR